MSSLFLVLEPIRARQLRRLQALWHRWTRKLGLEREADRALRHYYIERFTKGRAQQTRELTAADAALVIERLAELVREAEARTNLAAGTAGRHGYPERRRLRPSAAAWRAFWASVAALGMTRPSVDNFIRRHYAGVGLRGLSDVRTMADLNRVLWGLKAVLRRHAGAKPARREVKRAA